MKTLAPDVASHVLPDDGTYPNNARLPLVVYQQALAEPDPAAIETALRQNGWGGSWRNGVYSFHHYHSTAHEVLVCYSGSARVQLGGEQGIVAEISPGDIVVIPAGVAHKNLGSSFDFHVVGAYPAGQSPDMNYGKPGERPRTDQTIARLPLPANDPVFGADGPLLGLWH
jgi:uncharacterized protein YjlB